MTVDKILERVLHITTVIRILEKFIEPHFSAIQLHKISPLFNLFNEWEHCNLFNLSDKINKIFYCKERDQKSFCAVENEVGEKIEKEGEIIIAIIEAAPIIDETVTAIERIRQHK